MKKITSLKQLCEAAKQRKAVMLNGYKQPIAAAFVQNMQAWHVQRMIDEGMWIYERKEK